MKLRQTRLSFWMSYIFFCSQFAIRMKINNVIKSFGWASQFLRKNITRKIIKKNCVLFAGHRQSKRIRVLIFLSTIALQRNENKKKYGMSNWPRFCLFNAKIYLTDKYCIKRSPINLSKYVCVYFTRMLYSIIFCKLSTKIIMNGLIGYILYTSRKNNGQIIITRDALACELIQMQWVFIYAI